MCVCYKGKLTIVEVDVPDDPMCIETKFGRGEHWSFVRILLLAQVFRLCTKAANYKFCEYVSKILTYRNARRGAIQFARSLWTQHKLNVHWAKRYKKAFLVLFSQKKHIQLN